MIPYVYLIGGFTPLKNIGQIISSSQLLGKIKNVPNHQPYIISADPGLRQGRGGAWDHRRCGTCFVTAMAFTLSKVVPATSACLCLSGLPSFKGLIQGRSSNNGLSLFKRSATSQRPPSRHTPQPSVFKGVQACRLPGLKPFELLGRSSLPFASLQTLKTLKTFKTPKMLQIPRGSFHQALL